jgi:anhydro-N-acetylmuramic acid kinase
MSGTSLDGIDVAIVEIQGRRIQSFGFQTRPYPGEVREAILGANDAAAISRLNFRLGELYARAVLQAVRRFGPVELIGCHGQTIYHEGGRNTLQIGEPAVVAERTGIAVVSNFRTRDIAAGGQGAPLVPYADFWLFRHRRLSRVALNIGGIANITILPANVSVDDVTAFDTGPGNMVIDALTREFTKGRAQYDRDGRIAAVGRIDRGLLDELLKDPYYRRRPPKTCGREQFGSAFISRVHKSGLTFPDLIATTTALTAATIAKAIPPGTDEIIVAGGGIHNLTLMGQLSAFLPGVAITNSAMYGIDPDAKEAIAFALLAYETWHRRQGNVPTATGAHHAVVLGNITPV